MSVLTIDECKNILGLADNSYDEQIRTMIPYVQEDVIQHCNNAFGDSVIYREAHGGISFARGSTLTSSTDPDTITDDYDEFSTAGFRAGMDIVVLGGSNEGVYTLASVSTDTLTLTSTGEIENHDGSTFYRDPGIIHIARVRWPKGVKLAAAKMVWHLIDQPRVGNVQSERIDDYAVTYAGAHAYPQAVVAELRPHRRAVLI
jgi:hypothetical protein